MKFNARLTAIVVAVIALAATAWLLLYLGKKSETESGTTRFPQQPNTSRLYRDTVSFPPTPPEPGEVYSYSGTIQSINLVASSLEIATDRGTKSVQVSDTTQIVSRRGITREERMAMSVEERSRITSIEKPLPEGIAALTVGSVIEAVSGENIKGAASFESSKIIVIN